MMKNGIWALAALLMIGCASTRSARVKSEAMPEESIAPAVGKTGGTGPMEIGTDWTSLPNLENALFDTNRAELTENARQILRRNAGLVKTLVKTVPGLAVRVEGHCDERNTLEYNMALGERRALAVKNYYIALGVKRSALSTVSYGEERPVCGAAEEDCWRLNRRAVTVLKAAAPTRLPQNQ